jgi:hypothetical protein
MTLIGKKGCRNCAHHFVDRENLMCRRYPPAAHPVVVLTPKGPSVAAWTSSFAPVTAEMICGEHSYIKAYDERDASALKSS